ncbi:pentapeptide repeat-containing protein [Jhaorihella thermophila]
MRFFAAIPALAQQAGYASKLRMLGECRGCGFEGLDLSERKLTGMDLTEATLRDIDFGGAELNIALFDFAVIENVSFDGADLGGASFRAARLINVTFEGADLQATDFEDAILENTDLTPGRFCLTQMPNESTNSTECD